jgi:hypothetical protein
MSILAGPFVVAAALLGLGGALKAVRPSDTAHALSLTGLPASVTLVRIGAAAELVVAAVALTFGGTVPALLVAASFLAFLVFVLQALRSGTPISSCGCFGRVDTPPSLVHVGIIAAAVAVAVGYALDGAAPVADVLADQPLVGAPFVLLAGIALYLTFVALTALPKTLAETKAIQS